MYYGAQHRYEGKYNGARIKYDGEKLEKSGTVLTK
jgi:hypothetical protein